MALCRQGLESAIRDALAALSPESLKQISAALAIDARNEPEHALQAFRDAAREIIATDRRGAATFIACAELLEAEI
jgi:hypothetical protein